ncbi:DUF924 family protein [Pseudokordiimonas caeni]|uniref:DUF924 family protein n=1 Tax=Pseudokordiimonas caeni TaxID=2997908 RepID=UPI0028116C61|nr:DUF924 family protein [Pseudokordiimonas caeni]
MIRPDDILYFWFTECSPKDWWQKSKDFDDLVKRRFLNLYEAAAAGELSHWRTAIRGRLAEIIVLDQFPRNMFRDSPRAFAADATALVLSQEATKAPGYERLTPEEKAFLLMPFMHSESPAVHTQAVRLFDQPGLEDNLDFEHRHKAIIDRFGRYPHRNAILGRVSTPEEIAFLKEPGSSF